MTGLIFRGRLKLLLDYCIGLLAIVEPSATCPESRFLRPLGIFSTPLPCTLREDLQHRHFIETKNIAFSGPTRNTPWGEWGPDIICLLIPDVDVGTIKAFRSFNSFSTQESAAVNRRHMEAYFLIGTPERLGVYSQNQASVQTVISRVIPPTVHTENGFDYREVELQLHDQTVDSFGGISGGGLWKVKIYADEKTGKVDSEAALDGVAFWSHGVQNGFGLIRCHGPESILTALAS